jgi:tRNA 2-selenouridine synthase
LPFTLTDTRALGQAGFDTIIDVRSPSEYAEDHVPGAVSMPVLSDAERAEVGTIYTQESPFRARKIGAALVARNAARHIEERLMGMEGGWRPLVYCWRGGQRSGSFASILGQIGWRVEVLEGGYRTWRRLVVGRLYDADLGLRLIRLDGYTGTAKTALLAEVAALGGQVIDLEGLARHRGSILGDVEGVQPAQKGFETALVQALDGLDPGAARAGGGRKRPDRDAAAAARALGRDEGQSAHRGGGAGGGARGLPRARIRGACRRCPGADGAVGRPAGDRGA